MTDPTDCEHETLTEETLTTDDPHTKDFSWQECADCGAVVRDSLGGSDVPLVSCPVCDRVTVDSAFKSHWYWTHEGDPPEVSEDA